MDLAAFSLLCIITELWTSAARIIAEFLKNRMAGRFLENPTYFIQNHFSCIHLRIEAREYMFV